MNTILSTHDENINVDNIDQVSLINIIKSLVLKNEELEKRIDDMVESIQNIQSNLGSYTGPSSPTTLISPMYSFKDLPDNIHIKMQHIESLKDSSITNVMIDILEEMQPPLPMLCFTHKLYIYSVDSTWKECSNDELVAFLNKVHQKFVKEMCEWYSANKDQINESDQMSISYNKMMIKLMGIDFKSKGTLSKIKSKLCKYLKTLTLTSGVGAL
jgi:hypothetical protein